MQSKKMDAEDNLASRVASFSYYLKTGDQENIVQKIGGLGEDPMSATITKETSFPSGRIKSSMIKPSYAINFPNSIDSQDSVSSHRIASFSSLLDDPREHFAFKVKPGPVQDPKAALVLSRAGPTQVEKMNPANGEIGVFGADKYFNMKMEYVNTIKNESKNQELIDLPGMKSNLSSATPSVYSEASSWDSGAALLKNFPRKTAQTKPKMPLGRRIIASFGCTGQCMDSRAVYVAENGRGETGIGYGEKQSQQEPKRGEPFSFPILSSDQIEQSLTAKKLDDEKIEELRKSIEVFGSDTMKKRDIATNLERKLSMLTWDAIPKSASHPTTTIGSTTVCDDMASDASSDLFEIENISANGYPVLTMQAAGDDLSGCMTPTTQYAPSEASIEWSVVTASAVDFSSVISDYDEKHIGNIGGDIISIEKNFRSKNPVGKEVQKPRPGGLLRCKSQEAVNISEAVHKTRVERY